MKPKAIYLLLCTLLLAFLTGCRTAKQLPVESRTSTETKYITRVQRDTVRDSVFLHETLYKHDSTVLQMRGDTFYVERWHIVNAGTYQQASKERGGIRIDTLYLNRTDSVHVPYPVERKLTKWESRLMDIGACSLAVLGLIMLAGIVYLVYRKMQPKQRGNL